MKTFCTAFLLFACVSAHAQQTPALPQPSSPVTAPGVSTLRPEYAPPSGTPGTLSVPDSLAPNELRDLLRAQTEAIRALTAKVEAMQDNLRRIEIKLR